MYIVKDLHQNVFHTTVFQSTVFIENCFITVIQFYCGHDIKIVKILLNYSYVTIYYINYWINGQCAENFKLSMKANAYNDVGQFNE